MGLNNNDIIKKLRVALSLRDEDIIEILKLVDYQISKSELGAFFRNEEHPKFMPLQDQILRNFLNALVIHKRGPMERKPKPGADENSKMPKRKEYSPKAVEADKKSNDRPDRKAKSDDELPKKKFVRPKRREE